MGLKICWNIISIDYNDYLLGNSSKTDFDFKIFLLKNVFTFYSQK